MKLFLNIQAQPETDNTFVKLALENSGRTNSHYTDKARRVTSVDNIFDGIVNAVKRRLVKTAKLAGRSVSYTYWEVLKGIHDPESDFGILPQELMSGATKIARSIGYDNFLSQDDAEQVFVELSNVCLSNPDNTFLSIEELSDEEIAAKMDARATIEEILDTVNPSATASAVA